MSNVISLTRHRRLSRRRFHRSVRSQKVVRAQVLSFSLRSDNDLSPVILRNAFALPPLVDRPMTLINVGSKLDHRRPDGEDRSKGIGGFHVDHCGPDYLSGQAPSNIPLTKKRRPRTIAPMGRGTTPARFRSDLADRLRSARVVAGYGTQLEAANALGIGLDRYRKWESGRTPVPAQYVPLVCDLFSIDANYLFDIHSKVARKTA
jgi:hypothetical protein